MYILKRIGQGGGYVAWPGNSTSYVKDPLKARLFPTKEDAEKERCKENEIIVNIYELVPTVY